MKNFVVIDENKLCVVRENSEKAEVIASSILKGATQHYGTIDIPCELRIRPATLKDFDEFRLHTDGYATDPEYNFPKSFVDYL